MRNRRPLPVTIISLVYIVAGIVGLVFHLVDFKGHLSLSSEIAWVSAVRLLAIVSGIFMLRGRNGARWLALAWMSFHVVVGALHSIPQMLMHVLFLIVIGYFLLGSAASAYFRAPASAAETSGH